MFLGNISGGLEGFRGVPGHFQELYRAFQGILVAFRSYHRFSMDFRGVSVDFRSVPCIFNNFHICFGDVRTFHEQFQGSSGIFIRINAVPKLKHTQKSSREEFQGV